MRDPIIPQLEGDEYLSWEARQPERYELHHGFVVGLAGGTLANSTIALNVMIALRRAFPAPCRTFGSEMKIEISRATYYYPDAGVVCEAPDDNATVLAKPAIVCEVLSKSTRAYDVIEKRAAYRSIPALQAYVIVDTLQRRVELDLPALDRSWKTVVIDEGAFAMGRTSITLDELYEGTSVPVSLA